MTMYLADESSAKIETEMTCDHPEVIDDECQQCGESCAGTAQDEDGICHDLECPLHGAGAGAGDDDGEWAQHGESYPG